MSMLEQRIQQQFFESADLQYQTAESLARPVADAANALLGVITAGGKVMICGSGDGAVLARHLQVRLMGRFERERPPLSALALSNDPALAAVVGAGQAYGQQVRALGHPGDVLVVFDAGGAPAAECLAAVQAAQQKDVSVVVLAGAGGAGWRESLSETDVLVGVPHERPARILEMQLLMVHCLCDALDLQLMGEQENP